MKKILSLLLVVALACGTMTFISCDNGSSSAQSTENETEENTENQSDTQSTESGDDSEITIVTNFPSGVTVWEGSHKFYSDENGGWQSIPDGHVMVYFKGTVREGDQILITHEKNDSWDDNWSVFQMIGLFWQGKNFTYKGGVTNGKVDEWQDGVKYVKPYTGTQTTAITFSAFDAEQVNSTGGITLYGTGFDVKKVVIISDGVTAGGTFPPTCSTDYTVTIDGTPYEIYFNSVPGVYQGDDTDWFPFSAQIEKDSYYHAPYGDVELDIFSRKGTWTIATDTASNFSSAITNIPDVFKKDALFDVSWTNTSLTLTLQSDSTKTYTFTARGLESSSSSTEAISGTYKGTFTDPSDGKCYFIVYIKSDYTWYSVGYKNDSTYKTESDVGTIPESMGATYTRSGNTLLMKVNGFQGSTLTETAVTTDNWKTITLSGTFAGSLTRQ